MTEISSAFIWIVKTEFPVFCYMASFWKKGIEKVTKRQLNIKAKMFIFYEKESGVQDREVHKGAAELFKQDVHVILQKITWQIHKGEI